jgi:hypothetical protein
MHSYLEQSERISKVNRELLIAIMSKKANESQIKNALKTLTECLFEHHGVKPWLLIDEYDTPIQSGYLNNYYNEIINLLRSMLGAALKDNSFLDRAVITGILRVPKESLGSGLNNIKVYSILQSSYGEHFGFTESEVSNLLKEAGLHNKEDEVKSWYNGYIFGGTTVYNPWSIVNYVYKKGIPQAYWVNTSDIVQALLKAGADDPPNSDGKTSLDSLMSMLVQEGYQKGHQKGSQEGYKKGKLVGKQLGGTNTTNRFKKSNTR